MRIERTALLAALEPLRPALPEKTSVEGQRQIWFDGEYAYAHDGGYGVRSALETPFNLGVPGKLLLGLLRQLSTAEVTLEVNAGTFVVKAGKSSTKMASLAPAQRPRSIFDRIIEEVEKPATTKLTKDFLAALKRMLVVRQPKGNRAEDYGICVYAWETGIDLYARNQTALATIPVEQSLKGGKKLTLIPRVFAEQLVAQCKHDAELRIYRDHLRVEAWEGLTLFTNMLDVGGVQDLPGIVDNHYDTKSAPPFAVPTGFDSALGRAVLLAGVEDPVVTLATEGKKLTISGEFTAGAFEEEFEVDKALPKRKLQVAAAPLMAVPEVAKLMVGAEAVVLCGADDFLYVLGSHD